jgi:hypothetical protein
MNRLDDLSSNALGFLGQESQDFRDQRATILNGKVYHTLAPAANGVEGYNSDTDAAITVVARAAANGTSYLFKPLGLNAGQRFAV